MDESIRGIDRKLERIEKIVKPDKAVPKITFEYDNEGSIEKMVIKKADTFPKVIPTNDTEGRMACIKQQLLFLREVDPLSVVDEAGTENVKQIIETEIKALESELMLLERAKDAGSAVYIS